MVAKKLSRKAFFRRYRWRIRAAVLLFLLLFAVRGFEKQVGVFTQSYFPNFARQVTAKCVCKAVEKVLDEGKYTYRDFAEIEYSGGKVSAIHTNAAAINTLKNRVVAEAERQAEEIHNSVMYVPLGAFSGLTLIANYGPKIPLTYCLTGSFSAELVSSFESAGINQTVHHILLTVTSRIVTASVDFKDTLTFTTDFEIAQSVIVGEIPTTYGGYYTPIH